MSHDSEIKIGIFLASALAIAASAACQRAWRAYKRHQSDTWPLRHGVVTETAVHKGLNEITLTIRYSYRFEGEPYPISAEFQKTFPFLAEEEKAQRWADALDRQKIPVRVDPLNGWRSSLWESDLEPIVLANAPGLITDR